MIPDDTTGLRAGRYARQSRDKRASIARQLERGERRLEREGWVEAGTWQDGKSASRHARADRDDWPKVVAAVQAGEMDVLWLWESSRGDRTAEAWLGFLRTCRESGVLLCIEDHGGRLYDMSRRRDWRTLAEDGVDNEDESEKIRGRTVDAKDLAREEGTLRTLLGGVPPLGFTDQGIGDKDEWVTAPVAASLLRDVARLVLADRPDHNLHRAYVAAMKDRLPVFDARGREVNEKMVRAALQRPATAGMMSARGNRDEIVRRDVVADPPIDGDTFDQLAIMFKGRRRGRPVTDDRPYWAGPLLTCGKCGNPMSGQPVNYRGQRRAYLGCRNPHPALGFDTACRGVSILAADVDAVLRAAVERWAATSPKFRQASSTRAAVADERGRLQAELDGDVRRMRLMVAAFGDEPGDEDVLATMTAKARVRQGKLRDQIAGLTATLAEPPLPVEVRWDKLTGEERRQLVRMALQTPIVVAPGRGGARPAPAQDRMKLTVLG